MSQANTAMQAAAMNATGGREASRERRARLVQGKTALPPARERSRNDDERAPHSVASAMVPATPAAPAVKAELVAAPRAPQPAPASTVLTGVEASRARRAALVQGKAALKATSSTATTPVSQDSASEAGTNSAPLTGSGRQIAQAMRGVRARNGRGDSQATRPSGRVRKAEPIQYPPKVAESRSYGDKTVTGVRIGRGSNVTGDEPGAGLQVTGTQYVGKETGFTPREGGVKVGAARTAGGLVVTGTQVRSTVKITGDESNAHIRITGEADQELGDDLLERREQGVYTSMQFARQHNPHGHTVFGTNLGRSAKSAGSRERNRERALEQTDGGLPISGTAVGRSARVTGDEPGSCHAVTGSQYLKPVSQQPLCEVPGSRASARAGNAMGMNGRIDPVTGEKVVVSETWTRQRITGVDVEHNSNVSGDEYGACATVTGTPYVGPGHYEASCRTDVEAIVQRVTPGLATGNRVTGDIAVNAGHVTGTQRGGDRAITGTAYYCVERDDEMKDNAVQHIDNRFSVRSPQRQAQLRADRKAIEALSAESRITGTFAAGHGKITGNQEFHFNPRPRAERSSEDKSRITGEGRAEGPAITGSAWGEQGNVTGTEGYIAAERNPSERAGQPQAFAGAKAFKGKGNHKAPTQHVTGMVGWSAKTAARVTLSGGAQG